MRKKFILFIVEGKNDEREMNALLHTKFFDSYREKYELHFCTKGGDLTASAGVSSKNIQKKLNEILLEFRKNGVPYSNIKIQDIQEIVQIVDLDGTFIPPENIIWGEDNKFKYTDDAIITSNIDGAFGRNRKKAEILQRLIEVEQIGNVPYSVYYASCNMDHLLFNERSLSVQNKGMNAMKFQLLCQEHPEKLSESLFNPEICATGTYLDSWNDIQIGCNSLLRYTNINLFFSDSAKNAK